MSSLASVHCSEPCAVADDPVREWPPEKGPSLELFVRAGFVVGEAAGEASRGGCRGV